MKSEYSTVAALLHDVTEDTDISFDTLEDYGIPENILEVLRFLTHDKNVPYFDYVEKIRQNEIAREVKLADLAHNSDLTRLNKVTEADIVRVEKYKKAMEILKY